MLLDAKWQDGEAVIQNRASFSSGEGYFIGMPG